MIPLIKNTFLILLLSIMSAAIYGQRIATLVVEPKTSETGLLIPVHVSLDGITMPPDSLLQLVEVSGSNRIPVPYQVSWNSERNLYWIIEDLHILIEYCYIK